MSAPDPEASSPLDDRPPILGSWPRIYVLVVAALALYVAGGTLLTAAFR